VEKIKKLNREGPTGKKILKEKYLGMDKYNSQWRSLYVVISY
jgi:hypothetical protein